MKYEGKINGKGKKIALIWSRFNDFVGGRLLDGAMDGLKRHQVNEKDIDLYQVPGAFEIPFILNKLKDNKKYDAVICLGVVIRGETPHFEYVASQVSRGIATLASHASVPVVFGVLTTDSVEQAVERVGVKNGNKGYQAALDALEMADLSQQIN